MLQVMPNPVFPVTLHQFDPLMNSVVKLNILDAGLSDKSQRGIGLYLHTYDLYVKSGGKINYLGKDGHQRLMEDALTFCGYGNPVATRHGDLAAAHLAIDWHDTTMRCIAMGLPLVSPDVSVLLNEARHLSEYSPELEKRTGLLMDWLGKKTLI